VATVPPQHMFGLETSVLAPLLVGACTYAGRPFYPEDVRQALALADTPPTLVSTPLHLRACVAAALEWPPVQQVISATAPLDRDLAANVEQIMRTRVTEIFGCSEAGSFASRMSAMECDWQMYPGMVIEQAGEKAQISGGHLPEAISLSDHLQILSSTSFRFVGRHSDMIKVAGKRASLSELNIKLNSIPGVSDGIFVMREQQQNSVSRLLALVAAPGLDVAEIQQALAASIDPVFLPRPLLKVEALPRNDAQKLPRQALDRLLSELGYSR
jgi:acyl-coenzyme A synthetase/AMP-(fatty) acid ligase